MTTINYELDQAESITQANDAKSLSDQVIKLRNLEDKISLAENNLKKLQEEADILSGDVIPTMMQEMNIKSIKLEDGSAVEVKPIYGASISAERKEEAFNWLRENGLGDLIKNEVTVSFGRNEDNKAIAYANLAAENGYQPSQKLKVEPMTLKALVRERIEAGKDMPSDLFNVFAGNRTKITRK
jgi:hypothetical protein